MYFLFIARVYKVGKTVLGTFGPHFQDRTVWTASGPFMTRIPAERGAVAALATYSAVSAEILTADAVARLANLPIEALPAGDPLRVKRECAIAVRDQHLVPTVAVFKAAAPALSDEAADSLATWATHIEERAPSLDKDQAQRRPYAGRVVPTVTGQDAAVAARFLADMTVSPTLPASTTQPSKTREPSSDAVVLDDDGESD